MTIFFICIAGVLGFAIGYAMKRKPVSPITKKTAHELQEAASAALHERTEDRKDGIIKIMKEATERHEELAACGLATERKGVTRSDIEELLGVSSQTALKYLDELEAEGRVSQIGIRGKDVYYMLANDPSL